MTKAIESGLPKMKIEQSAAKKQARIDNKEDAIIGVNTNKLNKEDKIINILEIDNSNVRKTQIKRLKNIKKSRNKTKVKKILTEITN